MLRLHGLPQAIKYIDICLLPSFQTSSVNPSPSITASTSIDNTSELATSTESVPIIKNRVDSLFDGYPFEVIESFFHFTDSSDKFSESIVVISYSPSNL